MATEKTIKGKIDDKAHEGRAATIRKELEILDQLKELEKESQLPNRKQRWFIHV